MRLHSVNPDERKLYMTIPDLLDGAQKMQHCVNQIHERSGQKTWEKSSSAPQKTPRFNASLEYYVVVVIATEPTLL